MCDHPWGLTLAVDGGIQFEITQKRIESQTPSCIALPMPRRVNSGRNYAARYSAPQRLYVGKNDLCRRGTEPAAFLGKQMVLPDRIELSTSPLPRAAPIDTFICVYRMLSAAAAQTPERCTTSQSNNGIKQELRRTSSQPCCTERHCRNT